MNGAMPDLVGALSVTPGAPLPQALRSSRRAWASELARGRRVQELPGLLSALFNLCGHAHRVGAQLALSAAGAAPAPAAEPLAALLRRETATEHLRRIALDWPRLLAPGDAAVAAAAVAALRSCPLLAGVSAETASDPWPATRAWLENECLQMPAARWLRAWQVCGADWWLDWSLRQTGWLASLVRQARRADTGEALDMGAALRLHAQADALRTLAVAMDAQDGFTLAPLWQGAAAHTGCWARLHAPDAGLALTPWGLLGSRLAELARLCLDEKVGDAPVGAHWLQCGAVAGAEREGLAWVEMARGLLVHRVQLQEREDGWRVSGCQVLAPTEWNFHPQGEVARRVAALAPVGEAAAPAVGLLMAAFDPCVPFDIVAVPEKELSHA